MPKRFPLLQEISKAEAQNRDGAVYETAAEHPPRGYRIWPESKWDTDPHEHDCKCQILFGPLDKNPQVWIKKGKLCVAMSGGENKRRRWMTNIYESKEQERVGLKRLATTHGVFGPNHLPLRLPDIGARLLFDGQQSACSESESACRRRTTKCLP